MYPPQYGCLGHSGIPYHFSVISVKCLQSIGRSSSTYWISGVPQTPGSDVKLQDPTPYTLSVFRRGEKWYYFPIQSAQKLQINIFRRIISHEYTGNWGGGDEEEDGMMETMEMVLDIRNALGWAGSRS